MRTDTLTALLLDPFLTFGEAVKECGTTGRRENGTDGKSKARAKSAATGRTREANAPRLPDSPARVRRS